MASLAVGYLRVPVWVDGDKIKPLVNDDGRIPVVLESSGITMDVNLKSSEITLDINLKTASITLDVNLKTSAITIPTAEQSPLTTIQAQTYGWDLSNWHKLALLWGYSAIWDENLGGTATGTAYSANTATISAGYVYVLQAVSIRNNTRAMTGVSIYITRSSGAEVHLSYTANLAQFIPVLVIGMWTLVVGDVVRVYAGNTQADDVILAGVVGYKMAIGA